MNTYAIFNRNTQQIVALGYTKARNGAAALAAWVPNGPTVASKRAQANKISRQARVTERGTVWGDWRAVEVQD